MEEKLNKGYEPHDVARKWYKQREDDGRFCADEKSAQPHYSIVLPQPNVTGVLHMGHALNNTIQAILARWKRMNGYAVLWVP